MTRSSSLALGGIVVFGLACSGIEPDDDKPGIIPDDSGTTYAYETVTTPDDCVEASLDGKLPLVFLGDTSNGGNDVAGSCGGIRSEDIGHAFVPPATGGYRFQITEAQFDATLYVTDSCLGVSSLACVDVAGLGGEELILELEGGIEVIVVVDGYDGAKGNPVGPYTLEVDEVPLTEPACDDGIDGDYDGFLDCLDPDCEADPVCIEVCDDGIDNDLDYRTDCLDDDCVDEKSCAVVCPRGVLDTVPDTEVVELTSLPDGNTPSYQCAPSGAPDATFSFTAPASGAYVFDTVGSSFDTVLSVLDACGGTELACNDDGPGGFGLQSAIIWPMKAGQTVFVVVDGFESETGLAQLNVSPQ